VTIHNGSTIRKYIVGRCIECICCNLTAFPTWLIAQTVRLISLSSAWIARRHSPGSISACLLRRHLDVLAACTSELTCNKQLLRGGGLWSRALCRERCLESLLRELHCCNFHSFTRLWLPDPEELTTQHVKSTYNRSCYKLFNSDLIEYLICQVQV